MKKQLFYFFLFLFMLAVIGADAQPQSFGYKDYSFSQQANVGSGAPNSTHASAWFEMGPKTNNSKKGFLPPRGYKDSIQNPYPSLTIFDWPTKKYWVWNGTAWEQFGSSASGTGSLTGYYTKTQADSLLGGYYTKLNLQTSGGALVHWGNVTNVPSFLLPADTINKWQPKGTYLSSYTESDPVWSAAIGNYYTKTNLQTSGGALVHWGNITNVPSFGSAASGTNLGTGSQVYKDTSGGQLRFRSIIGTLGVIATQNANDVTVKLDTTFGRKYFGWPFLVVNDSLVIGDSSKIPSLFALQDTARNIRASIGAGGGGSPANPTATVGLAAVNGTATTFMRSDASPALSQAIAPTWTGRHLFSPTLTASVGTTASLWAIRSNGNYTRANTGDTAASFIADPTVSGPGTLNFSFLGYRYDARINGITIGHGNNNNDASSNTTVGGGNAGANLNNTTGVGNTLFGFDAGKVISSGSQNVHIGYMSGATSTTTQNNVAVGANTMYSTSTGIFENTAVGYIALGQITGNLNVGIGVRSCRTCGTGNVAIGPDVASTWTGNNRYFLDNSSTLTPLYGGDFSTNQAGINRGSYSAQWHIGAGSQVAGTAPIKLTYESLTTTAVSGNGAGIITVTYSAQTGPPFAIGSTVVIAGVTPSGYNGTGTVTACTATSVTVSIGGNTTTGSQTVAGTVSQGQLLTTPEKGAVEFDGNGLYVTDKSATRFIVVKVSYGTSAPTSTPTQVGEQYIDTTNKKTYSATGTASSSDWTILN